MQHPIAVRVGATLAVLVVLAGCSSAKRPSTPAAEPSTATAASSAPSAAPSAPSAAPSTPAAAPSTPAAVPEVRPGFLAGYLPPGESPDSLALLPPPPAPGSAGLDADQESHRDTRALRDTPRWTLAAQDADLTFPNAAGTFSCALGAPISEQATPHLYLLLRRSLTDGGFATAAAKNKYRRIRPFAELHEHSCAPQDEARLATDGSYPSGHSAIGWTWALLLAELAPDRDDAMLARGYAYGQSRVVCGVHWQSDVEAGRVVAAGVVARLHADPVFRADFDAAKVELAAARGKGLEPSRDCAAEAAALALSKP